MKDVMVVRPEIRTALHERKAVVALETTILSHGMPWPRNLECHHKIEQAIRAEGAVPAPIAVLDGKLRVG